MFKILVTALLFTTPLFASESNLGPSIDTNRISVSGVSAGGAMAQQLHIAYSDLFSGAGIISGVPFGCADGSLATAMARCMGKVDKSLSVPELVDRVNVAAEDGKVAETANLANDRVWLFHGTLDTTVATAVTDAAGTLYANFIPAGRILYVNDVEAGHNFPAKGNGVACTALEPPFVGNCDYDAAGVLLEHLYPGLKPPKAETEASLQTVTLPGATDAGLSDVAYLFVPPACTGGEKECALHLVLHGCAQSAVTIGTGFIEQSGYLSWAGENDIVLAFPQVVPGVTNPYACWDWWGYTGAEYRWRNGKQMKVVTDWIKSL